MTRVEFGNCIDCIFSDPSSIVENVKEDLQLSCSWEIEISLKELEGDCQMHMESPSFKLLLRDSPYVLGALQKANENIINSMKKKKVVNREQRNVNTLSKGNIDSDTV